MGLDFVGAKTVQRDPFTRPQLHIFGDGGLENDRLFVRRTNGELEKNVELGLRRPRPVDNSTVRDGSIGNTRVLIRRSPDTRRL